MSEARIAANRANCLLSTGPTSDIGKAASCLNAVKTALTGRTVLLRSDDAEAYRLHIAAYENEYRPVGLRECELLQSLADTQWRLNRIPGLEMAIYAQGQIEFEAMFEEHPPALRNSMIELQTHITYEKQLRNLQIQESRLLRRYQKEMAELRQLQKERQSSIEPAQAAAPQARVQTCPNHVDSEPATPGFVFSAFETPLDGVNANTTEASGIVAHPSRPGR
ncbi:MAG: hypothetical protein JO270_17380 [Acidobacteriaceae bacterium]|nr:hypothetical protein [Acidobacteriaceae bacterium]